MVATDVFLTNICSTILHYDILLVLVILAYSSFKKFFILGTLQKQDLNQILQQTALMYSLLFHKIRPAYILSCH